MPQPPDPQVIIVGAGASGILLANALIRPPTPVHVVLVDPQPGRGVAYGGREPHRLLNTVAGEMSLDPASPSGFLDWLRTFHPRAEGWSGEDFAPRSLYGDYLEQRLASLADRTPGLGSTRVIRSRAVAAESAGRGWSVRLAKGERLRAEALVIATGVARPRPLLFHGRDTVEAWVQDDPWDDVALAGPARGGEVLLVGSGLSALEAAEAVWRRDPGAKVISLSRHGLLPREHAPSSPSAPALSAPYPVTARELYAKLRASAGLVEGDGALREGVLRDLPDVAARLWSGLPDDERLMFLRHFRRYWDVERHRVPPAQASVVRKAIVEGRFEVIRGRLAEAKPLPDGRAVRVALLTAQGPQALTVARIVNCTGPEPDPFRSRNPLLLDLMAQGAAAADPLGLGLQVDEDSAVLNLGGQAAGGLYAMGALTQGRFFEILGVPEIRAQAERLASVILASSAVAPLVRPGHRPPAPQPPAPRQPVLRAISPPAAWS